MQLPLDTIDLDSLIEIIKSLVLSVIQQLSDVGFSLGDFYFTFWEFLLVCFVFSVIAFAMFRVWGNDDDD